MTGDCPACTIAQGVWNALVMIHGPGVSVWVCPEHAVEYTERLKEAEDLDEALEIIEELRSEE